MAPAEIMYFLRDYRRSRLVRTQIWSSCSLTVPNHTLDGPVFQIDLNLY
jgi:hypothetical protein